MGLRRRRTLLILLLAAVWIQNAEFVQYCFQIQQVYCNPAITCCNKLINSLAKIEFEVRKDCSTVFMGATINGQTKTAYFDTQFATGKVRVTAVRLNASSADQS
ncbi:DUF3707 domain-containing protein, partial [Haematococcus lacustris]